MPNLQLVLLDEQETMAAVQLIDDIFYHDQINPRWFDLYSCARYFIVRKYLACCFGSDLPSTIVTSDSDIAHYYDYSCWDHLIGNLGVLAKSRLCSYFAGWNIDSFLLYSDFDTMRRYFEYAKIKGGRCSDMHELEWLVQNNEISFSPFRDSFGIPMDTVRHFLYYTGLFVSGLENPADIKVWADSFPNGLWNDPVALSQVFSRINFGKFLRAYPANSEEASGLLFLETYHLRNCVSIMLESANKFSAEAPFSQWGAWECNERILPTLMTDLVRVPYIHFQGPAKGLISAFKKLIPF